MIKKLILFVSITTVVAFAQAADTTNKSKTITTSTSSTVASATIKGLKKQAKVDGGTTTWSKIKDLFN